MDSGPPRKRPRGGQQQRLKKQRAGEQEPDVEPSGMGENSTLAMLLLSLFAWGFFSPQRVQQIAELAVKDIERAQNDPLVLRDLRILANLGTKGKWANNVHNELMKKVEHVPKTPKPYSARIPLKGYPDSMQLVLLPHEMFSCIYSSYQHVWKTAVAPSVEKVQKFWRAMRQHPQLFQHPLRLVENWDSLTIPLALHGDGVPITGVGKVWSKIMTNYSWYSLVGTGNTASLLMWVWGFFDKLMVGDQTTGTLFEFYSLMKWSFEALAEGKWPSRNHHGEERLYFELCLWCSFCLCLRMRMRHVQFHIFFAFVCFYFQKNMHNREACS